MKSKKLFLASGSVQRKRMLREAGIDFECVEHVADERSCAWAGDLGTLTRHLAQLKMAHVVLPVDTIVGQECFVLTADTLTMIGDIIIGKPRDYADAIAMIKKVRDGVQCGTGFCIERRAWDGNSWCTQQQYTGYAHGWCSLAIADQEIEHYFVQLKEQSGFNYLALAGSFSITGYGAQFLKEVHGSYTAILGLPLVEVRDGLRVVGF